MAHRGAGWSGIRPVLPGGVPLLIPLTWFVFSGIPLVILAPLRVTGPGGAIRPSRFAVKAALFATCLTAYDVALEPAAVATGLWTWSRPGLYYGSPCWNLAGWWILTFLLASVGLPLCGLLTPRGAGMAANSRIVWTVANAALAVFTAAGLTRIVGTCVPVLASLAVVSPVLGYSLVQSIREWRSWRRGDSGAGGVGGAAPRCVTG